jgi:hypothetical protein
MNAKIKLQLSTETLRTLTADAIETVQGGRQGDPNSGDDYFSWACPPVPGLVARRPRKIKG